MIVLDISEYRYLQAVSLSSYLSVMERVPLIGIGQASRDTSGILQGGSRTNLACKQEEIIGVRPHTAMPATPACWQSRDI